jgi:tetratricopeptide (TPR) repeat protein
MFRHLTHRQFALFGVVLIALCACLVYANTLDGEFVWDDASSILLHRHVQDPGKIGQLFRENQHAFAAPREHVAMEPGSATERGRFYRPLLSVTFMIDFLLAHGPAPMDPEAEFQVPDVSPLLFHVSNMLWHAAAAVLLFLLLITLAVPRSAALAAVLIYVVHPLHTEAVTYISGRADMMAAAFMYAGLLAALWSGSAVRRMAGTALSGLCFLGALLSKESGAIFPVLLTIMLLARHGLPRSAAALRNFWPLAGAVAGGVVYAVLRAGAGLAPPPESSAAPLGIRLVEVGQALAFYLRVLLIPTNLHMEQTLEGTPVWTAVLGYGFLLALLAVIIWTVRADRPRPALAFAWFLAAWLPISGIFPLNAPMAEHWLYVPMAGFWWGVAELAHECVRRPALRRVLAGATAVFVAGLAVASAYRNQDWHSNERLYRATLASNPDTMRVRYNLGVTYESMTGNHAGARREFEYALALGGPAASPDLFLSLGAMAFAQERPVEAATYYTHLLSAPNLDRQYRALATMHLGRAFLALGYFQQASMAFQQAAGFLPEITRLTRPYEEGEPLR